MKSFVIASAVLLCSMFALSEASACGCGAGRAVAGRAVQVVNKVRPVRRVLNRAANCNCNQFNDCGCSVGGSCSCR